MNSENLMITYKDRCTGCNKCIRHCPIFDANIAYNTDNGIKVRVNPDACIACGACIDACDHEARDYIDDTHRFFDDLAQGKKISVIVAPAIRVNIPQYKKLFSYLKSIGVNVIYDVSFGADITTWAYLKTIKDKKIDTLVAQPCPSIVSYIEIKKPDLIKHLAPIQSPMLCTAIFLKKYQANSDPIAFLSPCIAKKVEIEDRNTNNYINYNVTYKKLMEYLNNKKVNLANYNDVDFEDIGCSLGCLFSRPGGLRENIEANISDAWVKQVEGTTHAYHYLEQYQNRVKKNQPTPLVVDILNCIDGCNIGTGTSKNIQIDDVDCKLNELKKTKSSEKKLIHKRIKWLYNYFENNLKTDDFIRKYSPKNKNHSYDITNVIEDEIYGNLHKHGHNAKTLNCGACGYETCIEMVKAINYQLNLVENCIDYNRQQVLLEKQEIEKDHEQIQSIMQQVQKLSDERQEKAKHLQQSIQEITAALSEVAHGSDENAREVENIAEEIQQLTHISHDLRQSVQNIEKVIANFSQATGEIVDI